VKFATVRDLKNQTTALIRQAENGKTVVVTRRGKPVATLKPFEQKDLQDEERYPSTAFDNLKRKILAKYPQLAKESPEQSRRRFDKITKKIKKSLPFKTWQEMTGLQKETVLVVLDSNIFVLDRFFPRPSLFVKQNVCRKTRFNRRIRGDFRRA
jgi:prevent-host-death family protein